MRTPSWVDFPKPKDSDSDSADSSSLLTQSSHNGHSIISFILGSYETEGCPVARPRLRSETDIPGRSGKNNRRLIVVDSNLVNGGDLEASFDRLDVHTLKRVEVSRLVRSTLGRKADTRAGEGETSKTKEVWVENPPPAGHKNERVEVFKVMCPDTNDLWKMPVIPGESLDGFASRVKQKTGGDVILFMDDEILASEEDWKVVKGGGRIVAHLIR